MKRAIIYYSLSENTKAVAESLANDIGADLIPITMRKKMPSARWQQILVGGRMSTFGEKPAISELTADISQYDEIIIGAPIWAGRLAAPMNTVLANQGILQKVTAVFTLSGSGDNTKCMQSLAKKLPNELLSVSLVDRNNALSADNDRKIKEFEEKIVSGEKKG